MLTNTVDIGEKIVKEIFGANETQEPKISTSQIRKFLSAVNAIENQLCVVENNDLTTEENKEIFNRIQYLRIKLAYQAGRDSTKVPKDQKKPLVLLKEVLDKRIINIKSKNDFVEFARLIESIVAYHKYYGGE